MKGYGPDEIRNQLSLGPMLLFYVTYLYVIPRGQHAAVSATSAECVQISLPPLDGDRCSSLEYKWLVPSAENTQLSEDDGITAECENDLREIF
jgi:hypothetical protein